MPLVSTTLKSLKRHAFSQYDSRVILQTIHYSKVVNHDVGYFIRLGTGRVSKPLKSYFASNFDLDGLKFTFKRKIVKQTSYKQIVNYNTQVLSTLDWFKNQNSQSESLNECSVHLQFIFIVSAHNYHHGFPYSIISSPSKNVQTSSTQSNIF